MAAEKLQTLVSEALTALVGGCVVYTTRLQSGTARRGKFMLRLCVKGTPDNLAVLSNGKTAYIECKGEGDSPSAEQRAIMAAFGACGVPIAIVTLDSDKEVQRLSRHVQRYQLHGVAVVPLAELQSWIALHSMEAHDHGALHSQGIDTGQARQTSCL